jgi:hypothetical protein
MGYGLSLTYDLLPLTYYLVRVHALISIVIFVLSVVRLPYLYT